MLKCNINQKKKHVWLRTSGDLNTITVECLALFKGVYRGIEKQNPEAAKEFKNTVIAAMLDSSSPLWKEK